MPQGQDMASAIRSGASEVPEDNPSQGPQGTQDGETEESVPEKFRDKSKEEVIASHQQLENKLGEQGQELGHLRDQLNQLKGELNARAESEEEMVTEEDLLEEVASDLPEDAMDLNPQDFLQQTVQAFGRVMDRRLEQFEENRIQPIEAKSQGQQLQQAVSEVAARNPDFDQYIPEIEKRATSKLRANQLAKAESHQERVQIMEDIYRNARENGQSSPVTPQERSATGTGGNRADSQTTNQEEFEEQAEERVKTMVLGQQLPSS